MSSNIVLQKVFGALSNGNNRKWVIWGCGKRGERALKIMQQWNLQVEFWIDNNRYKTGKMTEGLMCFARSEIDLSDYSIMISPLNSNDLYRELDRKYENVIPTEGLECFEKLYKMFLAESDYKYLHERGHFYEPYPDLQWVKEYEKKRKYSWKSIKDINFNIEEQKELLSVMESLYDTVPNWGGVTAEEKFVYRYHYNNTQFEIADALFLHCMLRIMKPKRVIEIGSGYSSAVMLDTNEFYFDNKIKMTFVEPYPQRLKQLMHKDDHIKLFECMLQDINKEIFETLEENDILFIDSSHVSKRDSDVNELFFEVLPLLKSGVCIHIHDIMPTFEYPMDWLEQGNVWNEMYLLRSFLQNNNDYKIVFFEGILQELYNGEIKKKWPYDHFVGGSSFWMKKL